MAWGALMGLGQGLQNFGNVWSEREKAKLAEQLAQQREERAEARQLAREERQAQRQATTVAGWQPVRDDEGVLWMQSVNSAGTPLSERRLANPTELKNYQTQEEKEKISLEKLTSEAASAKFKAGRLETEAALDDEYNRARIDSQRASAQADRARAQSYLTKGNGEATGSNDADMYEYVDLLKKEGKDILDAYADKIPAGQIDSVLKDVVQQAAQYKIHPRSLLGDYLLERYGAAGVGTQKAGQKPKVNLPR